MQTFTTASGAAKDTQRDKDQGRGSSRKGGREAERIEVSKSPLWVSPRGSPCWPELRPSPPAAHPSVHKALFEVASEGLALVALDLAVLDGPAIQEVVHLRGVDGSRPLLVLGRGLADPVVDVIGQTAAGLVDLGRTGDARCAPGPGLPRPPAASLLCMVSHTQGAWAAGELGKGRGEAHGAGGQEPRVQPPPRHRLSETLRVLLLSSWK